MDSYLNAAHRSYNGTLYCLDPVWSISGTDHIITGPKGYMVQHKPDQRNVMFTVKNSCGFETILARLDGKFQLVSWSNPI